MRMRLGRIIASAALVSLGLTSGACGRHDSRAMEILNKVDAAVRAVKVVQYTVVYEGVGDKAAQSPTIQGSVIMTGWADSGPDRLRAEAQYKLPSGELVRITLGRDAGRYFVIDHRRKKVHVGEDLGVLGSYRRVLRSITMFEFVHPSPFSEELRAEAQALRGVRIVGGEECHEVFVDYPNEREALWFFSKKDFLPRGVQRRDTSIGLEARQTLTSVLINPALQKDPFHLEVPEGYAVSSDPSI